MQTHEKLAKLVLLLATTVPKVYYCYHFHIKIIKKINKIMFYQLIDKIDDRKEVGAT